MWLSLILGWWVNHHVELVNVAEFNPWMIFPVIVGCAVVAFILLVVLYLVVVVFHAPITFMGFTV